MNILNDDPLTQSKKYLRMQTGLLTTVTQVKKSEYKGKESVVVTFQDKEGALIDAKFYLPFSDITTKTVSRLLKATGASKLSDLQGKEVGIQINMTPNEKKPGSFYFNPAGYFPASYLNSQTEGDNNEGDDIQF